MQYLHLGVQYAGVAVLFIAVLCVWVLALSFLEWAMGKTLRHLGLWHRIVRWCQSEYNPKLRAAREKRILRKAKFSEGEEVIFAGRGGRVEHNRERRGIVQKVEVHEGKRRYDVKELDPDGKEWIVPEAGMKKVLIQG